MLKLIFLMAIVVATTVGAPAPAPEPVPPILAHHPVVYPVSPYVKVIPYHSVLPLTYHHGYKLIHPGSVYVY